MKFGVMFGVCWHASTINKVGKLRNELNETSKKEICLHAHVIVSPGSFGTCCKLISVFTKIAKFKSVEGIYEASDKNFTLNSKMC